MRLIGSCFGGSRGDEAAGRPAALASQQPRTILCKVHLTHRRALSRGNNGRGQGLLASINQVPGGRGSSSRRPAAPRPWRVDYAATDSTGGLWTWTGHHLR